MSLDRYFTAGDDTVGRRNRFWMLNGQKLQFENGGDFNVDVGLLITLTDNFQENYGGLWIVTAVNHWFKKDKFTTVAVLSRGCRLKDEEIERGKQQ